MKSVYLCLAIYSSLGSPISRFFLPFQSLSALASSALQFLYTSRDFEINPDFFDVPDARLSYMRTTPFPFSLP
ncbi:MAG: hypothetical protein LBP72_00450, partial [Dysgonamonadaceae bacterium]|nr:hypothetical protein [Dysgonamonadaceae bacterium]